MTSLAVWLSVDSRGPSGIYIIADSRITWGKSEDRWDCGQKTFASRRFPDVFGYCGDAYFPPMILRQILEQMDAGLVCSDAADAIERHEAVVSALRNAMAQKVGHPPMLDFSIYHVARDSSGMSSFFRLWLISYHKSAGSWADRQSEIHIDKSRFVHHDGTGAKSVQQHDHLWQASNSSGTSRAIVWAFCDSLHSGADQYSGGAPQLVGLWRIGSGRHFGFLWHGKPYLAGLELSNISHGEKSVQWFNHLFERCDVVTGSRLSSAQKHKKPRPAS